MDHNARELARRIIELDAEVHQEVDARRYEKAAHLRDCLATLQARLQALGDELLSRNVQIAISHRVSPLLNLLEGAHGSVQHRLLTPLASAPRPLRWVLPGVDVIYGATIGCLLETASLESLYFRARFPLFSPYTLLESRQEHFYFEPSEWIDAAIAETSAQPCVVWLIGGNLAHLGDAQVLAPILAHLRQRHIEFVACVNSVSQRFTESFAMPGVSVIDV